MVDAAKNDKAPLEDLMAAMDVVDTLRHDHSIAERELDGEGRRERLLERLRDMYSAQGIAVPDHVLEEGIDALEQERFQYTPVKSSWQTKVAGLWVSRSRWGKALGFFAVVAAAFYGYYFVSDVMPLRALKADLPSEISRSLQQITASAKNPEITAQAQLYAANAERAIANQDYEQAQEIVGNMQTVQRQISLEYDIRVISRANENSGVFRNPPGNAARNYYLIVEAIDRNNRVVELTIVNQENNKTAQKKTWGLRVSEKTFYKIASDKSDDGIIQNNKVGRKLAGYLKPEFSIPTTGATITEW
jgi:hypothetical protein